jgi:uncharacterized BrkB/YihY/UPF0761 family membrane protein
MRRSSLCPDGGNAAAPHPILPLVSAEHCGGRPGRWRALLRRWRHRLRSAGVGTHAAAVAYHSFLALVPLTLALFGVAALVGQSELALGRVQATLQAIAPPTVAQFVDGLLMEAEARLGGQQGWVIAISCLLAVVLGSRAALAIQRALAGVEGIAETRRGLPAWLVAVGLTLGGGLALLLASVLLVAGGRLVRFVEELSGAAWLQASWNWLRIPVSGAGLYLFLLACYRWGPPRPLPRASRAALLGTVGVLMTTLGFGLYLALAPALGATFAVLGAVAVTLVWLYSGALVILLAAAAVVPVGIPRPAPASAGEAPGAGG